MSKDSVGLIKNTSALSLIQLSNYVFPLLLIPYLSRILGLEKYGIVAFGLGLTQLAFILTDYGFSLSATYQIAKANKSKEIINQIISSVFICKLILVMVSCCFLFIFILVDHKYSGYHDFFWLMILPIIGQAFQPIFFFQGLEKMVVISIITSIGRTFYLISTIIFVNSDNDYIWVAVTHGSSHLIIASIEIYILLKMGYRFLWPAKGEVHRTFSDSTPFFWGRAAAAIYTAGGTIFLGIFSNPIQVGLYSAAEQLYKGALSLIVPLHQALYPYMIRTRNVILFKRIFLFSVAISIIGVGIGMLIMPWIISFIFGKQFIDSIAVMSIFMIAFIFVIPSGLLGFPFLSALGDSKTANISIVYGGFFQIFLLTLCFFGGWINAIQAASCILFVEVIVFSIRFYASSRIYREIHSK